MFVSHEKNVIKKPFQKPNILRRKTNAGTAKPPQPSFTGTLGAKSLLTATYNNSKVIPVSFEDVTRHEKSNNNNHEEIPQVDAKVVGSVVASSDVQINSADRCFDLNPMNVDSFINGGKNTMGVSLKKGNLTTLKTPVTTTQAKKKWCIDFSNSMDFIIDSYSGVVESEQNQSLIVGVVPKTEQPAVDQCKLSQDSIPSTTTSTQAISLDCFSNRAVKFKCDEPNCTKGFWSEEKLKKHKNSHKRKTVRTSTQLKIECPVKKVNDDGTEVKCERVFPVRGDLLKHLNTDHTPEDAVHKCAVCGRRFFWASGLRAHAASVCARGGLACGWPGCSRVFRLPCRLREHARAHTGDRPYVCVYPNCGWAFRSASKLVRHARRHTDERRHACAECGRAFLRKEHLREHAARHHAPSRRAAHVCAHAGCEQTFTNMSTLYMHMKKVHRKDENKSGENSVPLVTSTSGDAMEDVYLVSLVAKAEEPEWHAARTHCTWPLARAHAAALDDDGQVEQADGSSNVYTVRSDLFLHGNAPIDEDSQHMGATEIASEATPLDADLCLIDSHPTIGLMQEELMYDDTAVDESSFRVLLMNGEELT